MYLVLIRPEDRGRDNLALINGDAFALTACIHGAEAGTALLDTAPHVSALENLFQGAAVDDDWEQVEQQGPPQCTDACSSECRRNTRRGGQPCDCYGDYSAISSRKLTMASFTGATFSRLAV